MRWILIILGLIYLLSPIDFLPDMIPLIGVLDDLAVLGLIIWFLFFRRPNRPSRQSEQYRTESDDRYSLLHFRPAHDPYTALGIPTNASPEQIKSAYRKKALQYHPDKAAHLGEEYKILAEKRFIEIQKAYETLMPKNKTR